MFFLPNILIKKIILPICKRINSLLIPLLFFLSSTNNYTYIPLYYFFPYTSIVLKLYDLYFFSLKKKKKKLFYHSFSFVMVILPLFDNIPLSLFLPIFHYYCFNLFLIKKKSYIFLFIFQEIHSHILSLFLPIFINYFSFFWLILLILIISFLTKGKELFFCHC